MAADKAVKPSEMDVITELPNNAVFIVSTDIGTINVDSKGITAQSIFNNVHANSITSETTVSNNLFIDYSVTPSANNDNVGGRRIWWDASFLYVALSNTEIRRISLEVF